RPIPASDTRTARVFMSSGREAQQPGPASSRLRLAVQGGSQPRVDSKNPAGATDGEAELGQREQDPQPVPLTGYVEGPQRDLDLPQEATEPGQPRQRAEQEP